MYTKGKIKVVNFKNYLIPLIFITIIFVAADTIMIHSIRNYYYNRIREESLNFAKNYTYSLDKSNEAYHFINNLLDEKILVASRMIANYDEDINSFLLDELAHNLEVDKIYYYNAEGVIIYSSSRDFIGWKATEGHPVYDFMKSKKKSYVEDIQQDTRTGISYKFGYYKSSDGSIVQVGVYANRIKKIINTFEVQNLIDEMSDRGGVTHIHFIDNDFKIIGSSQKKQIGNILSENLQTQISGESGFGYINHIEGKNIYEVYSPVFFSGVKIGTLCIGQSIKETQATIWKFTTACILILAIIFFILLYAMITSYRKNKNLLKLAYNDVLTGLPNKLYLEKFLSEELEKSKSNNKAIILINCSNFKTFNLTIGFQSGDNILLEITNRLRLIEFSNTMLFRFTADRFLLYIDHYEDRKELITLVNKINEKLDDPFHLVTNNQYLNFQIGVVEIGDKIIDIDHLLKKASIALTHIKDNTYTNYSFFNEEMEKSLQRCGMIEQELRSAITGRKQNTFYLEYQPLVDLKTNKIVSFEALARMKTKELGFVSPMEFIDVAEKKQLIVPLGNLILKTACEFIHTLNVTGFTDIKVAVNISGIQLLRDDFIDTVNEIINETNISESNLELEITETVLLDNFDIINDKLKMLRENDIKIALDDFGTGYSSFSRLSELNIDIVKIDKYFINEIPKKQQKDLIAGDIISMSHRLGLTVVTEGVEVEEQRLYLIKNECDIMQGYLFSRPLAEDKAINLLKSQD